MEKNLGELATFLDAKLIGDPAIIINGLATLELASQAQVSFFHDVKYLPHLKNTKASAVILSESMLDQCSTACLVVKDTRVAHAKIASLFAYHPKVKPGIHPTAVIGENCKIDPTASIGPFAVIEDDVQVGAHTLIGAYCFVGEGCELGESCRLDARVTLYHHIKLFNRVMIASGTVIGADGFGYAFHAGRWSKVAQIGRVILEDDVEVGANTTIDRGAVGDTLIRQGVKLDNLIQIGHNVEIGNHTAIAACTGVAGSTKIGRYCMIGGGVGILGHIEITDQVNIIGMTGVSTPIKEKGTYASGVPLLTLHDWKKSIVRIAQLDKIAKRIHKLERIFKKEGDDS